MKSDAPYNSQISDNKFRAVRDEEVAWGESDVGLPPGLSSKRLHVDPTMKRRAGKASFPPGYIEPEHWHDGWHCVMVMKGRMCVAGKDLRPGDYVFGWDIPHGPFEYPDGCEVFTVSLGESLHHQWDEETFWNYQRQWQPETEEGRRGCAEFDRWRKQMAEESRKKKG